MPDPAPSVLPGSVVAAHLATSAAELAAGAAAPRPNLADSGELAEVIGHLVTGQQHIAATLARLARLVGDRRLPGALVEVPAEELATLTEVLRAAADAAGYSAQALAETRPMIRALRADSTGEDTRS